MPIFRYFMICSGSHKKVKLESRLMVVSCVAKNKSLHDATESLFTCRKDHKI